MSLNDIPNEPKVSNFRPSMVKSFKGNEVIKKKTNTNPSFLNDVSASNANPQTQSIQSLMNSIKLVESKKKRKINESIDSFRDMSQIQKKEIFNLGEIDNSIFNASEDWNMKSKIEDFNPYSIVSQDPSVLLGEQIKTKIQNAAKNEEIILPDEKIVINFLVISKPIHIKGQLGSCIEVIEGPILIEITENTDNNYVYISQAKIVFNNDKSLCEKKTSNLFELQQGSLLQLEDCDIVYEGKKSIASNTNGIGTNLNSLIHVDSQVQQNKPVVFCLKPCNHSGVQNPLTTVLTITNTRISNFYQTVRSGQNTILNIDKCCISKIFGKSIVMLNPLIIKINETIFDKNSWALHIKFIKEDLVPGNRVFFFNKNTVEGNMICGMRIEGIKDFKCDTSMNITITGNTFRYNNIDGCLIMDVTYDSCEISKNIFSRNRGIGLNIQKVVPSTENSINANNLNDKNTSSNASNKILIKDNNFSENSGFGLFVNESLVDVIANQFLTNKESGMLLCSLILDNPKRALKALKDKNYSSSLTTEGSSSFLVDKHVSNIRQNMFFENGENGIKILNYNFVVYADGSIFRENCCHGIFIDQDAVNPLRVVSSGISNEFMEKIKAYKIAKNSQAMSLANLIISRCIIEKNLKSGISMNNCLIFCRESYIIDNIGSAIYTPKKEFQYCFKECKTSKKKNTINGTLGGEWGEININSKTICSVGCMNSKNETKKKMKIEKDIVEKNRNAVNTLEEIHLDIEKGEQESEESENLKNSNSIDKKKKENDGCVVN